MEIKVKYHADIPRLDFVGGEKSDWIDLYAAEDAVLMPGEYRLISLGVSMKLPNHCEALVLPRSSTFKRWGITMANSMGVIDGSYQGDNDVWRFPALAHRATKICRGDRIAQFRVMPTMRRMWYPSEISIVEVDHLDGEDRGGIGSTGHN